MYTPLQLLNQTSPLVPRTAHEHLIDHDNGILIEQYVKKAVLENTQEVRFELTICQVTKVRSARESRKGSLRSRKTSWKHESPSRDENF